MFEIPATFEMTVWFEDGEQVGKVTIDLPTGKYPTEKKIKEMLEKAKEAVEDTDLTLCTPKEFGSAVVYEKSGQRMHVGGLGNEFEKPYSTSE